jgi:hypothetical protein
MLVRFLSSSRCRSCATAFARGPRSSASARGEIRDTTGDRVEPPLFVSPAPEGTGGAVTCCGSGGILAALPKPLGSLTELLSPVPAPGPIGMPLTPAEPAPNEPAGGFCADDGEEIARTASRPKTTGRRWQSIGKSSADDDQQIRPAAGSADHMVVFQVLYASRIATARVQPAEARSIFTGKHDTMKPVDGSCSRWCNFSMWQ